MKNQAFRSLSFKGFIASVGLCLAPLASATVVTFDGLPGSTGDTFITYNEAGFTVESQFGAWKEAHGFGNAAPSIHVADFGGETFASLNITASGGLPFIFESIDFNAMGSSIDFQFGGSLGGMNVFSFNDTQLASVDFKTVLSTSAQPIDHLRIDISTNGAGSFNIDNINVQAIPEPQTYALMLAGIGLVGFAARRFRTA